MNTRFINQAVFITVILIILNVVVTVNNNRIIEQNRALRQEAEEVKVTVSQFGTGIIHNLDLSIRGYALFKDNKYLYPLVFALRDKDSLFYAVGSVLQKQGYPLEALNQLQDSVDAYASFSLELKKLLDENRLEEFLELDNQDLGYKLWLQYEKVAADINKFEDGINNLAVRKYNAAITTNYIVELLLFVICLPTLFYMAYQTKEKFAVKERLRLAEKEKTIILSQQKELLETQVAERTKQINLQCKALQEYQEEIIAQNEELLAQQDEIVEQKDQLAFQNRKIMEAQEIIMIQNRRISAKNEHLEEEITSRTQELLEYNKQLQQFAFIAAHNLRAPAARILGLGNILKYAEDSNEERRIIEKLVTSTRELDRVIKDLNVILEIKGNQSNYLHPVNLNDELNPILLDFADEIRETETIVKVNFEEAPVVVAVKAYIDSILFNLLSNAINYRSLDRKLKIEFTSFPVGELVCLSVSDNGLGLNLEQHKENVFSLYRRFHFHVEGKGMGLYLVKTQVLAMGGKIEVESTVDFGTVFRVYLKRNV